MKAHWKVMEENVREALERELGVSLPKKGVDLTGADKPYEFDMVSPDGTIVGETKSSTWIGAGKRRGKPHAKIAQASEACLLLLGAKDAKERLLVLTDPEFYEHDVRERQGLIARAHGVTIRGVRQDKITSKLIVEKPEEVKNLLKESEPNPRFPERFW